MGGVVRGNRIPIVDSLDFNAPRVPVTATQAPEPKLSLDDYLGLSDSDYSGLQKVGDTDYYYGNNRMYEMYTPPPPTPQTIYGIMGYSTPSNNTGLYGYQPPSKPKHETITRNGQQFRTIDQDVQGFTKTATEDNSNIYKYSPSMADYYSGRPKYEGRPQIDIMPLLNLSMSPLDTGLINPEQSSGAGRFLNGGVLGFDFGESSGQEASE